MADFGLFGLGVMGQVSRLLAAPAPPLFCC